MKERKKKEERADRNRSLFTIARTGPFLLFACVETPHSDIIDIVVLDFFLEAHANYRRLRVNLFGNICCR